MDYSWKNIDIENNAGNLLIRLKFGMGSGVGLGGKNPSPHKQAVAVLEVMIQVIF